jgi:hypothetical protein
MAYIPKPVLSETHYIEQEFSLSRIYSHVEYDIQMELSPAYPNSTQILNSLHVPKVADAATGGAPFVANHVLF